MFEIIFGTVFSAFAFVVLVAAVINIVRGIQSRNWPTLSAKVVVLDLKQNRARGIWYVPIVRYQYEVSGSIYESDRIMFAHLATPDHADAERFLSNFQVGDSILIRVSPVAPQRSVIKPGIDRSIWFQIVWSIIALVLGARLAFEHWK
jgi:hypothetical protein